MINFNKISKKSAASKGAETANNAMKKCYNGLRNSLRREGCQKWQSFFLYKRFIKSFFFSKIQMEKFGKNCYNLME